MCEGVSVQLYECVRVLVWGCTVRVSVCRVCVSEGIGVQVCECVRVSVCRCLV